MIQDQATSGVMRARAASAFLGIGTSTLWRWVQQGKVPPPIRLSARCSVWRRETLERILDHADNAGADTRPDK